MTNRLVLLLFFSQVALQSCTSTDKVENASQPPEIRYNFDYQHVYHFGESEWESSLILFYADGEWYGQISSGEWSDGEPLMWIKNYENLRDVKIIGDQFYSDKTNGEFVIDTKAGDTIIRLKVYNSWSGGEGGEYGYQSNTVASNYSGQYAIASYHALTRDDLAKLDRQALKIMRNEIYARYGYKFKAGGAMAAHFKELKWYQPYFENVDRFLTNLEKKNIELIQVIEKEMD